MHPGGPDQVAALAAAPPRRTVVWLDELQRYGYDGLRRPHLDGLNRPHHGLPDSSVALIWPRL
jgi:hypothetical protein